MISIAQIRMENIINGEITMDLYEMKRKHRHLKVIKTIDHEIGIVVIKCYILTMSQNIGKIIIPIYGDDNEM
jgi:hypothetical protein